MWIYVMLFRQSEEVEYVDMLYVSNLYTENELLKDNDGQTYW